MIDTTPDILEPSGALRAWLAQYDLIDLWLHAEGLPTPRADFYRRELLRLYVVETRRSRKSRRHQTAQGF